MFYLVFVRNRFAHESNLKSFTLQNIFLLFVTEAGELWEHLGMEAIHAISSLNYTSPPLNAKCQSAFSKISFHPCTFPNYPI